jgi:hypothetical protein
MKQFCKIKFIANMQLFVQASSITPVNWMNNNYAH